MRRCVRITSWSDSGRARGVWVAFDVLDGIEMLIYGVGALVLLIVLAFLGVRAASRVVGPVGAAVAVAGLLAVATLAIRDLVRRSWTLVSICVVAAYSMCLVALIIGDAASG